MIKALMFSTLTIFAGCAMANNLNIEQMVQQKMNEMHGVVNTQGQSMQRLQVNKIREMAAQLHVKQESQQGVMIFVSLSMPKPSLRQILVEARAYKIPVLIRGLVNNSFKDTKAKMDNILQQGNHILNGATELNPMWFRQFNIQKVPAFVSYKRGENCSLGHLCQNVKYDVLYGNISVDQALGFLANKAVSVNANIAGNYLKHHTEEQTWTKLTTLPHAS